MHALERTFLLFLYIPAFPKEPLGQLYSLAESLKELKSQCFGLLESAGFAMSLEKNFIPHNKENILSKN